MRRRRDRGYAAYRKIRRAILAGRPSCALCGGPGADTIDHILPVSRGGTNAPSNLRPAHARCNGARGTTVRTRYATDY